MQFIRRDERGYHLDDYLAYLHGHAKEFPTGARDFALAAWHYDLSDRQCPHDSWLECVTVREISTGKRDEIRSTELTARFLSAYHDAHFDLVYDGVSTYALELAEANIDNGVHGHGDWLIDELTLSASKAVIHDIHFSRARWTVHCADLRYSSTPRSL